MSVSRTSKKRVYVFYHVYKRFFYFRDKTRFNVFFYFFPNVYYVYGTNPNNNHNQWRRKDVKTASRGVARNWFGEA